MEIAGSLLDDQQLNEQIESTVQKILGNMNQLMDRLNEASTNCTLSLIRVDTIAADVSNLKTEKSVIHTIVRDPPKREVSVATNHRTSLDMLIDKINEMDDSWCETSLEKYSAPVNFELRARLLSENEVEASSSIEHVPEELPRQEALKQPDTSTETSIEAVSEARDSGYSDVQKELAPKSVPPKTLFSDTSDSENEAKNLQKPVEEVLSNSPPDFRKELAARFATPKQAPPKALFSDDSEQESSSPPPPKIPTVTKMNSSDLQKELLAEIVKSKMKPKKKIFSDDSDSDTANVKDDAKTGILQKTEEKTKSNGVNDSHSDVSARKTTPPANEEELPPQKSVANGGLTIQQELAAKFAQKNPPTKNIFEDDSDSEKSVPIPKSNGNKDHGVSEKPAQPTLNGTASVIKSAEPIEKSVEKINGTKAEIKKVVLPKKFSLLDDSDSDEDLFKNSIVKKPSVINQKPPQKPLEISKPKPVPVKSLLDSDSDDPDSLFQKKPTSSLTKPKLSDDISQVTVETKKEQQPKKVVSKSIFLDSDSDDELFKPKTVKPETKLPESSEIKKTLPTGKIQNSNFAADLNTLLSKPPTLPTAQSEQLKPEIEATDNLSTILKSRPKAPTTRRPRGTTSQKPTEPTVNNEIPFFDPLS